MTDIGAFVADNLDVWTSAIERKSSAGRGGSKKIGLYGLDRLRALILELAVRGKLVAQDPRDEPASELLKAISLEKKQLFKNGRAKLGKPIKFPKSWPFEIPKNWQWSQLGTISNYGETEKAEPGVLAPDVWVLELEDVEKGTSKLLQRVRHESRPFQSQKNQFRPGDVIYGKLRPYLDKVIVADESGVCTTEMMPIRGYANTSPHYIRLFLKTPFFIKLAADAAHGMNLPRLSTDNARIAPFALPPQAEQKRIVAKVDELMALCDALEHESEDAMSAHQLLVETLLATLVNSADAADLALNWARLETHFDTLFTTDASIDALKQSVLDLAVRGKLVLQDPNDEPAKKLIDDLKRAKTEAMETRSDRRIKAAVSPPNPPFPLPKHWSFQSFENLFLFIDYRGNTPTKTSDGIPLITAKNVRMGYLDREPREYISHETFTSWMSRGFPKIDDLFFTTEAPLGNICQNDVGESFAIAQRVICLQPYGTVETRFFMFALMSMSMQKIIDENATGMTARGIKSAKLKPLPLPVPPLSEQKRIVDTVNTLLSLCERMKSGLAAAAETQRKIADAITQKAAT